MRRLLARPAAVLAALAAALALVWVAPGCGYIGGTQPPLANIPAPVTDFTVLQRGAVLIANFTVPHLTTEGMPLHEPLTFDLRIGGSTGANFNPGAWAETAKRINQEPSIREEATGAKAPKRKRARVPPAEKEIATYLIPTAEWTGKDVTIAVRLAGENTKESAWSGFVNMRVVPPPEKPAQVTPAATAKGVRLTWRATGQRFRIFRKTPPAAEFTLLGEAKTPEYVDATAEYGKPYTYQIQTVTAAGPAEAESEISDPATITPVDTFPPAPPAGLTATAAPNSVELSWEGNSEPDLAGYHVFRAVGAGPFEKIADVSSIPTYSDTKVEPGKMYRYAISAFDKANNESERSPVAEVTVQ